MLGKELKQRNHCLLWSMNTSNIVLADQTKLMTYEWLAPNEKIRLVLVHGYGEHAGRYDSFAKALNEKNISVMSYDQRGYGKSDGSRAYVKRFQQYVDDLKIVVDKEDFVLPTFMMGHSMGGLVAVSYFVQNPTNSFKGLISSSALLAVDKDLSPILQMLAPIIGFLFPQLKTEKLDQTYLTRSEENRTAYNSDPLMYVEGTKARTAAEMLKTVKTINREFNQVSTSLLVLHGEADRLTMPEGSQKLYDQASANDKEIKIYPGLYHELIHEPEREEVIGDISSWVLNRV